MTDMTAGHDVAERPATAAPPRWAMLGVIFGLLSAVAIALYGPIGVSGTYPRLVGSVARAVVPAWAAANPYLVKMGSIVTPESMLVVGLLIGGFIASRLERGYKAPAIEPVHRSETTSRRRYVDAFIGGFLILVGARIAGGCTSGHIISGITQLSISSMIFAAGVFGAGIFTAKMIRGVPAK